MEERRKSHIVPVEDVEEEEEESENECDLDEENQSALHKYVDTYFGDALEKVKYIKHSCGKVPKDTQSAVDNAVNVLQKSIHRIRKDLEPKFAKLQEMEEMKQEQEAWKRQNAALERAHSFMVGKLEDMHANAGADQVALKFPKEHESALDTMICNRKLLSRWSPAMEKLLNPDDGSADGPPATVSISNISIQTFRVALSFETAGKLSEQEVRNLGDAKEGEEHPLLLCADLYDLEGLRAEYFHIMRSRKALDASTAGQYLELAIRYNAVAARDEAAALIAKHISPYSNELTGNDFDKIFLVLSAGAAASVLAQDNVTCTRESSIIDFVRNWADGGPHRAEQVGDLLQSLRLELCSFKELAEMPEVLNAQKIFSHVRTDFLKAIQQAVKDKLASIDDEGRRNQRKRKFTRLNANEDESYVKVARFMQTVQVGALGA